jgi:hypothetical protein
MWVDPVADVTIHIRKRKAEDPPSTQDQAASPQVRGWPWAEVKKPPAPCARGRHGSGSDLIDAVPIPGLSRKLEQQQQQLYTVAW